MVSITITRRKRTPLSRAFLIVGGCVVFLLILSLSISDEKAHDEVLQGLLRIETPAVENNNNAMNPVNNAKESIQGVPSETTNAETSTNAEAQTDPASPQVAQPQEAAAAAGVTVTEIDQDEEKFLQQDQQEGNTSQQEDGTPSGEPLAADGGGAGPETSDANARNDSSEVTPQGGEVSPSGDALDGETKGGEETEVPSEDDGESVASHGETTAGEPTTSTTAAPPDDTSEVRPEAEDVSGEILAKEDPLGGADANTAAAVPVSETPAANSDPAATTTDEAAVQATTHLAPPVEPSSVEAMLQQAARDSTPKKDATAQSDTEASSSATQESYPPVNCETVLRQGYRQESAAAGDKSLNPNNDQIHARFIQKIKTPFWLSLHHETYDSTPYLDIMRPNQRDAVDVPGVYNQTIVTAVFQEILESSQDGIVLDVGANVGWYSLLSRAMGRTVEAFEPLQSNVFRLCESVFLNRWTASTSGWDPQSSGVNIHNVAIGHRAREALFSNVGSEVMAYGKTSSTQSVAVQIAPLDSIARAKGWLGQSDKTTTIALLKINLGSGGGESPVFQGAPTLLSSKIVKNIVMTVQSVDKLWVQTLLDAHYTVHKWGNWTGPDQDFTRLDVFEALRDYAKPMTIWWKQV